MKDHLEKMKSMRNGGRKEGKNSKNVALGLGDDDDYDGTLLVDGGVVFSKEWIIDFECSFYICCENFSKFKIYDGDLVTLPNNEMVKVEGIGDIIIKTHGRVKRRLSDARYVPKLESSLISLGRL